MLLFYTVKDIQMNDIKMNTFKIFGIDDFRL